MSDEIRVGDRFKLGVWFPPGRSWKTGDVFEIVSETHGVRECDGLLVDWTAKHMLSPWWTRLPRETGDVAAAVTATESKAAKPQIQQAPSPPCAACSALPKPCWRHR